MFSHDERRSKKARNLISSEVATKTVLCSQAPTAFSTAQALRHIEKEKNKLQACFTWSTACFSAFRRKILTGEPPDKEFYKSASKLYFRFRKAQNWDEIVLAFESTQQQVFSSHLEVEVMIMKRMHANDEEKIAKPDEEDECRVIEYYEKILTEIFQEIPRLPTMEIELQDISGESNLGLGNWLMQATTEAIINNFPMSSVAKIVYYTCQMLVSPKSLPVPPQEGFFTMLGLISGDDEKPKISSPLL